MRRDMYRIGPVGWTALAVAAFGNGQQTESRNRAPDWALVPALAALGAGPSLLKAAIKTIKDPHLATGWERLVSAAGSDGRVLVARVPEDTPDDAPIDPSDRRHGVLLALRQEPIHYRGLLDWIASTGVELVRLEGDEGGS